MWPGAAEQLSNPGILFLGASGTEYNLFSDPPATRRPTPYELYKAFNGRAWGYDAHSYGTITMGQTFSQDLDRSVLSGGVPEPAAWTMMILGFGAVGAVLRRRRGQALIPA